LLSSMIVLLEACDFDARRLVPNEQAARRGTSVERPQEDGPTLNSTFVELFTNKTTPPRPLAVVHALLRPVRCVARRLPDPGGGAHLPRLAPRLGRLGRAGAPGDEPGGDADRADRADRA